MTKNTWSMRLVQNLLITPRSANKAAKLTFIQKFKKQILVWKGRSTEEVDEYTFKCRRINIIRKNKHMVNILINQFQQM